MSFFKPFRTLVAALCFAAVLPFGARAGALATATFNMDGVVRAPDEKPLPDALCSLTGGLLPEGGISVTSDVQGKFQFPALAPGRYNLTCAAMGYQPVKQALEISDQAVAVQVTLPPSRVLRQTVEVHEQATQIDTQHSSQTETLHSAQLMDLPLVEQKFKAALPLVPGVIRTPDGRINVKGVPESQGLLMVNSAETTDPVTGSFAIDVPLETVESLQVQKDTYRAQYGGYTGGLVDILTKPPSGKWHAEVQNFTPNPRIKSGTLVGLADYNPRLYFTGPLIKNRLNFSEALAYDIDKQPVRGLAWPHNEIKTRDFGSYTSFQYAFSPQHLTSVDVDVFPLRRQFANISSLMPQSASSDYGQTGFSVGWNDRWMTAGGSILSSVVQGMKFDSYAHGQGPADMLMTPNGYGGDFFNAFRRYSTQEEVNETFLLGRRMWHGRHDVAFGGEYLHRAYEGSSRSHSIRLLRNDESLAERIDFPGPGELSAADHEGSIYVQDHWTVTHELALDLGLRFSGETLGAPANAAPRTGFAYSPHGDGKTVLRGGLGLFYAHAPLLAGDFTSNPIRQITLFDPQGIPLGPTLKYQNLYGQQRDDGAFTLQAKHPSETPWNMTWSGEVDREIIPNVTLRLSYLRSRSHQQFIVDPLADSPAGPALVLAPHGDSDYREFETTLRWHHSIDSEWNISYVYCRSRGDLNLLSQVYVPFEQPVIRPDTYAPLPSDVPHRLVSWGRFETHIWGIFAAPLIDWHSGFPYYLVNEYQNYVGAPNRKRFPRFFSVDLKLGKEFHLPFPWLRNHLMRGTLTIFNLTNNGNPRDVFNNITSPYFGHFVGFQHRFLDTELDILY
jgi:Carboxypeptidase regulatory-like domain